MIARGDAMQAATIRLAPVADPEGVLRGLLSLARRASQRPLPFGYGVSRAYAQAMFEGAGEDAALAAARGCFERTSGEGVKDPYPARIFPSFDELVACPGSESFAQLSREVFDPMLAARSV
jgi:hypothetical protein